MAYVQIQTLTAQRDWPGLVALLEDLEAAQFPSSPLPSHPLSASAEGGAADADVDIDAPLTAHDARVYALLLIALLLVGDGPGARLLHRRTPFHVRMTSWELNAIADVAAALHKNDTASALTLLASFNSLPTLRARAIHVEPAPATTILLVPDVPPVAAAPSAGAILAHNLAPQTQPRAFSRLVRPLLPCLADAIAETVLRSVARAYTGVHITSLGRMLAASPEQIRAKVEDGSLHAAMGVESVSLDGDVLHIVKGTRSAAAGAGGLAGSGPGLQQVQDLAKYLMHLEREI
ncbi:hypothetical protein BC830DRAFT_1100665 [Chytriomyces sp. MP71]|nr:hypothetical protein BC830DRAFT_1100665 [Chytriomyces sp. MP71]